MAEFLIQFPPEADIECRLPLTDVGWADVMASVDPDSPLGRAVGGGGGEDPSLFGNFITRGRGQR